MNNKAIKPVACKYNIGNVDNSEYVFKSDNEISIIRNYDIINDCISYWTNEDMKMLVKQYNIDSEYCFPEHCLFNGEIYKKGCNKRTAFAYIDNVVNPYIRMDKEANLERDSFLETASYNGRFSDNMVKHLQSYPIVGYGFPSYLAIHSKVDNNIVQFYKNPAPSNWRYLDNDSRNKQIGCDELFDKYYEDRCALYKAIHVDEYQTWNSKLNSKWEGDEAKHNIEELDNTFVRLLLKQEQENVVASSKLLSLYGGKLDKYVNYFINYLNDKLLSLKPQQTLEVGKQVVKQAEVKQGKDSTPNIPIITNEMVNDFAEKFGVDKKDNYREILEHCAQLSSSKIAHYLYMCKTINEQLNTDLSKKQLHDWLIDNGFKMAKYRSFCDTFK